MRQRQHHDQGEIIKTDGGFLKAAPKYNPLYNSLITAQPQFLARKQMQQYPQIVDRSDNRSMMMMSVGDEGQGRPIYPSYSSRAPSNAPFSREPSMVGNRPSYVPVRAMPSYQGAPASSVSRLPSNIYPNEYKPQPAFQGGIARENSIMDGQTRRSYQNPYSSVYQGPARQASII
jgi:hypothetical protein